MNTKLDEAFFEQLLAQAHQSPRKRSNYNLHKELSAPVQRLCLGLTRGTYIRPHLHPQANKAELLVALRGTIKLIIFDADGRILEKLTLGQGDALSGIEMPPGTFHTMFPLTDEAVVLEVKEGPFTPTQEHEFAAWAPPEGDAGVAAIQDWFARAEPGDRYIA